LELIVEDEQGPKLTDRNVIVIFDIKLKRIKLYYNITYVECYKK